MLHAKHSCTKLSWYQLSWAQVHELLQFMHDHPEQISFVRMGQLLGAAGQIAARLGAAPKVHCPDATRLGLATIAFDVLANARQPLLHLSPQHSDTAQPQGQQAACTGSACAACAPAWQRMVPAPFPAHGAGHKDGAAGASSSSSSSQNQRSNRGGYAGRRGVHGGKAAQGEGHTAGASTAGTAGDPPVIVEQSPSISVGQALAELVHVYVHVWTRLQAWVVACRAAAGAEAGAEVGAESAATAGSSSTEPATSSPADRPDAAAATVTSPAAVPATAPVGALARRVEELYSLVEGHLCTPLAEDGIRFTSLLCAYVAACACALHPKIPSYTVKKCWEHMCAPQVGSAAASDLHCRSTTLS